LQVLHSALVAPATGDDPAQLHKLIDHRTAKSARAACDTNNLWIHDQIVASPF
jgi:hypothetical protein